MIKKINKIKNLGIFNDWKPTSDYSFTKYNLFYGWNGSGKSTLSKIFRSIEFKEVIPGYQDYEFEIELADTKKTIIDKNFNNTLNNIKVFNQTFIKENTELETGQAKSIIYIGKDNADLKKEIDNLKKEENKISDEYNFSKEKHNEYKKNEDDFHKNNGDILRAFFRNTIFSTVNYDKRDSQRIWQLIKDEPSLKDCVLSQDVFEIKKSFIAQNLNINRINFKYNNIQEGFDKKLYNEINEIINTKPVNRTIERLSKNTDIANWVQTGIAIHKEHQSNNCEFCGRQLDEAKLLELSGHFNEEFINLQNKITKKLEEIDKYFIKDIKVEKSLYYVDYHRSIDESLERINICISRVNEGLDFYKKILEQKFQNPLCVSFPNQSIIGANDVICNQEIDQLNRIIDLQNKRIEKFDIEAQACKTLIEKHFVAEKAIKENFKNLLGLVSISGKEVDEKSKSLDFIQRQISDKQVQFQNDFLALDNINRSLHKFLAHEDISLEKNDEGGYLLKRGENIALHLSEGEKTAIALIYFIVKLSEKGNKIEDTIIVFDDPISSFDSNHLFNAFTYITKNCKDAKQLFVMTHSFWFFKLLRDWMLKQNEKLKDGTPKKSSFYELKRGDLEPANNTLLKYHSEYHYVFQKLYDFNTKNNLTLDESFTLANAARRVLESFSAFKKPNESGMQGVLNLAKTKGIDSNVTDKIYYFLNKYSHLDRIETFENTIENIENEGSVIAGEILNIISTIDPDHFSSMETICKKN